MKKWEDIFKDKLGGMIIALPERSLDEFRTRLDAVENASHVKRFAFGLAMVASVTAGLSAIIFLRQPTFPENIIQVIRNPETTAILVSESTDVSETEPAQKLLAQASVTKPIVHNAICSQKSRTEENHVETEEIVTDNPIEDYVVMEVQDSSTPETQDDKTIDNQVEATPSPFIPNDYGTKNKHLKVGPALGIVGGGSLLATILASTVGSSRRTPNPINSGTIPPDGSTQQKDYSHSFPLILGISTKIPINNRLFLTSGLDYSVYTSRFAYSISGGKKQVVRYLGIPVCLDFSIASTRWLDVYVGGGLRGDYCINASHAGIPIKNDGFSLSILGSGGIQFNATPRLGIYIEPEISYLIPFQSYRLETYRTDSPVVFSVKSGLRISISK